jgi:uncharacterized protein (DUF4415 family)
MARKDMKQYLLEDLKAIHERGDYVTTKPEALTSDIGEEFWQNAHVVMPPGRASVHLRVDSDVLEWFKAQGKGHLTRMNAVLRSYVAAHKNGPQR